MRPGPPGRCLLLAESPGIPVSGHEQKWLPLICLPLPSLGKTKQNKTKTPYNLKELLNPPPEQVVPASCQTQENKAGPLPCPYIPSELRKPFPTLMNEEGHGPRSGGLTHVHWLAWATFDHGPGLHTLQPYGWSLPASGQQHCITLWCLVCIVWLDFVILNEQMNLKLAS